MLHSPALHEPLSGGGWDAERARSAIREIAEDCDSTFDDGWPAHPGDLAGGEAPEARWQGVYLGGAGVVQALDLLARRDLIQQPRDYVAYLERPYHPDLPKWDHRPSLWAGETGVRLVLQRLAPSAENLDRLAELVSANVDDEHGDVMWGTPGTMLAARELHALTGEARFLDLWRRSAAAVLAAWDETGGLWTQHLYGKVFRFVGAGHGFAGCVTALLPEADTAFHRRVAEVVRRFAVEEDGRANWPPLEEGGLGVDEQRIRVQWCHGAPGMVTSLAPVAPGDDEHRRLMLAGGELTWHAGPLVKGAGLCHGTAGNGYAFLALFELTGDELWLERARAFAVHAIGQVRRERAGHGMGRYSLWTGDPGTAVYLADCLAGGGSLPLP